MDIGFGHVEHLGAAGEGGELELPRHVNHWRSLTRMHVQDLDGI